MQASWFMNWETFLLNIVTKLYSVQCCVLSLHQPIRQISEQKKQYFFVSTLNIVPFNKFDWFHYNPTACFLGQNKYVK